jgi:hypothetical protein
MHWPPPVLPRGLQARVPPTLNETCAEPAEVLAIDLTEAPVVAGIVVLAVFALGAVWWIPRRQARQWKADGIAGKDLAELVNSSRTTLVQTVGGIALILTFIATWTQIAETRKTTNEAIQLSESQQETDRFTRAVEELGANNFALRLGGIYSLQKLARDSPQEDDAVIELMLAYLHRNHPVVSRAGRMWEGVACFTTKHRPLADTQAALDVILSLAPPQSHLDLSFLDLRAVHIQGRNLTGDDLRNSSLVYAEAERVHLDNAALFRANLRGACLTNASLRDAHLDEAITRFADFSGADLRGATGYQLHSAHG